MTANYHTHTFRCNHAFGKEREYIENAIACGFKTLGFSDHAPYVFEGEYYSGFRMKEELLENYIVTLNNLKKEYEKDIRILIGFEAEYYPRYFSNFLNMISKYDYNYLILGQHFTGNETDGFYSWDETNDENRLALYALQCAEAINTGKFVYIAHPDIINFTGDDKIYKKHMLPLCEEAKKLDIPLEFNMLGFIGSRNYPSERFFKIAAEVGNKVIIGSDAHEPSFIFKESEVKKAKNFLLNLGIKPLEELDI